MNFTALRGTRSNFASRLAFVSAAFFAIVSPKRYNQQRNVFKLGTTPEEYALRLIVKGLDARSEQELADALDRLEAIAAIEKGLEESKQGKGVPAREFLKKMQKKYKIQAES